METLPYDDESITRAYRMMNARTPFEYVLRGAFLIAFRELHSPGSDLEQLGGQLGPLTPLAKLGIAVHLAPHKHYVVEIEEAADQLTVRFVPSALEAFESAAIPADIARVLEQSEGEVFASGEYMLTLAKARELRDRVEHWRRRNFTPVAGDGCGNYYVVIQEGAVAFFESVEAIPAYLVASSLSKFVSLMRNRASGGATLGFGASRTIDVFDEAAMLAHDPALAELGRIASLPWEDAEAPSDEQS